MSKDTDTATVLRAFTIIFTILPMLLALACIGRKYLINLVIIYGYVHYHTIWTTFGTFGLVAFILLLVAVALIVVPILCGLCGAACRSRCCLICFTIFIVIWAGILIALGVVAIVLPPSYFSTTDDSKCLKIAAFNDLQTFSEAAQKSICYSCGCYFTTLGNYTPDEQTQLALQAPMLNTVDASLPIKAQDCGSGWDTSSYSNGPKIYAEFEDKFKCTGWCGNTTSLYYHFTDVNNGTVSNYLGKPEAACYNRISSYIKRYGTIVTIISFVLAGLMLVAFFFAVCYLCKMGQGGNSPQGPQAPGTGQNIVLHVDGSFPSYSQYPPSPYPLSPYPPR